MTIAVVALGYADGLPRQMSNRGHAYCRGNTYPLRGRVCMDYCQMDCTHSPLSIGDMVEFWGEHILANDVAQYADTIAYTLFTGVASRVKRQLIA